MVPACPARPLLAGRAAEQAGRLPHPPALNQLNFVQGQSLGRNNNIVFFHTTLPASFQHSFTHPPTHTHAAP